MIKQNMKLGGRKWTKREIEYLRDNSSGMFTSDIAKKLNRSINSVVEKRTDLGIMGCKKHKRLSDKENKSRIVKIKITFTKKYMGDKHWGWKGGKSEEYYKRICFQKYGKKCFKCKKTKFGNKDLCVHHLDGDRENNRIENLIPICKSCHSVIHRKIKDLSIHNGVMRYG